MNYDNIEIVSFTLADFADELHPSDLERLARDERLRTLLRDRFLDALSWKEAAEAAADAWKDEA